MQGFDSKQNKKAFAIIFGTIVVICWAGFLFCAAELYERVRWVSIVKKNRLYIQQNIPQVRFRQVFSESLWERHWFSYKKNQEFCFYFQGKYLKIRTNNVGLRDSFIVIPKPSATFRILCVGGSTTFEGLTNDTTYPKLLEKKLRKAYPEIHLEVINGGISGLNSFTELEKIHEYLALQPDLILEYNAVNDICWLYFPSLIGNNPLWKQMLIKSRLLNRWLNWQLLPPASSIRNYFESTIIKNLSAFQKAAAQRGVPVIFCSFSRPDLDHLSKEDLEFLDSDLQLKWQGKHVTYESYSRMVDIYNQALKDFCRERDIAYIPLAENHMGGLNFFIDICHATEVGKRKKVEIIFRYLKNYLSTRVKGLTEDS